MGATAPAPARASAQGSAKAEASSALLDEVQQSLRPQLETIDAALASGKPGLDSCDACLHALLFLAPLLGPSLEPIAMRVALGAAQAARGQQPPPPQDTAMQDTQESANSDGPSRRAPLYYDIAQSWLAHTAALKVDRDAAVARMHACHARLRAAEGDLASARERLDEQASRMEDLLRDYSAKQSELRVLRIKEEQLGRANEEGLTRQAHVYRTQGDERVKLESKLAELQQRQEELAGGV